MKDSTLRIVLFAIIITFGSLMIVYDIPVFYLLAGTVMLGILVIFLTGTVKFPHLKEHKRGEKGPIPLKETQVREKETKPSSFSLKLANLKRNKGKEKNGVPEQAAVSKERGKKPKPEKQREKVKSTGQKGSSGEFFSSLKGAFTVLGKNLKRITRSKREKETEEKKIDTLLDQSIKGSGVVSLDAILPDTTPAEKKKESDPFTALVVEDLNADLVNNRGSDDDFSMLDDNELAVGIGIGKESAKVKSPEVQAGSEGIDLGIYSDEIPSTLAETNDADQRKSMLEADTGEIDLSNDAGMYLEGDAIKGFDGLDHEGIDLREAEVPGSRVGPAPKQGSTAGMSTPGPTAGSPPEKSEPPKSPAPTFSPEQDMLSFTKGIGQEEDLMAALTSDVKSVKKNEYASLIRDLKDIRVDVADLRSDLEDLLKPKKPGVK